MIGLRRLSYEKKRGLIGLLIALPWVIGFIFFFLVPIITSVRFSFSEIVINEYGTEFKYQGFSNFKYLFLQDPTFVVEMIKAALSVFKDLFLVIAFSLFLALILSQDFHGRLFARAVFFLPVIIASGVVLGIINGDEYSQELMSGQSSQMQLDLLQNILINTGLSEDTIKTVVDTVSSIFNITWRCGIQVLIFLSGIKSIPISIKEAASVEGATSWEFFWKITFPMLLPMVQLNVVFTIVDSFTDSSNSIISRIYSLNQSMDFSYGSTIAWTYFIIVFIIVILVYGILNRISRRYER